MKLSATCAQAIRSLRLIRLHRTVLGIMIGMYAIITIALIGGGAALGIVAVVSLGIRHEEKASSLTIGSPGRAASGARAIMRVYARCPGVAYQARAQQEDEDLAA
jgi:hypothetical protein